MTKMTDVDFKELLDDIESAATNLLSNKAKKTKEIEENYFIQAVRSAAVFIVSAHNENDINEIDIDDIPVNDISKKLQERFNIQMSLGTMFSSEKYKPWLADEQMNINWYYWERYRKLLINMKFSPYVVTSLSSITDQILDHLENPKKEGSWDRRGLVVGHIQSGKTANYTGLICKAADCGYKVIIVLAGMLNSLRSQTQERIDLGFIGRCTRLRENIGAGKICSNRIPVCFTTSTEDFKRSIANNLGVGIGDLNEPVVLVVKKNTSTLRNLISWMKDNNPHKLQEYPMLLVDDEADQASINTRQDGATAINTKIRELLGLFDQSSYVGYTATPFANIFIDPDTDSEMLGDDLFPRNFILSLDPPDNYIGPEKVFAEDSELNILRDVEDFEDSLPLRHNKVWSPEALPDSLLEAIRTFILIRAIRLLRKQNNKHNSMMINVSRFTGVQSKIKILVEVYLQEILRPAISNHCNLNECAAIENNVISELKDTWEKEFSQLMYSWESVQKKLHEAVSPIGVIEVNSSRWAEPLDYSEENYPNGRNVIAVGGLSLSRGLTLEGLSVSYFLRNSIMYDTLLQMGRWFGYRDGYADLCRVFMTGEASSWYSHISNVLDELRTELRRMKGARMTPSDFGLCVRAHPESLIVTARNKMRSGHNVVRQIDLQGRLIETAWLWKDTEIVSRNISRAILLAEKCKQHAQGDENYNLPGKLWRNVPVDDVMEFVNNFENHPFSQGTQTIPVVDYINWLKNTEGLTSWEVLFVSVSSSRSKTKIQPPKELDYLIPQVRRTTQPVTKGVMLGHRKVASEGRERAGLAEGEIRVKPLLMVHLLDCRFYTDRETPLFEKGIVAYGICFPGEAGQGRPKKLTEYVVNAIEWRNAYSTLIENEEDLEDEYE